MTDLQTAKTERLEVLFLTAHDGVKGPLPKVFATLIPALVSQGCTITTQPWGQKEENEGVLTKVIRAHRDIWSIVRTVRQNKPHILLVNTAHDWKTLARDIPLLLATRLVGHKKTVLWLHGSRANSLSNRISPFSWLTAVLVFLAKAIFLLSHEEERLWRAAMPRGNYYLVKYPLPAELCAAADTAKRSSIPSLLFVGRLIPEKGILDVVAAMPAILTERACELTIAGEGPLRKSVVELSQKLGVSSRVHFVGYIGGPELAKVYSEAWIFVLPTYHDEGFPVVLLEAMQAGLPVVTTNSRGASDWLIEGTNVAYVHPRSPVQLAKTLTELLVDPPRLQMMAHQNRKLANQFEPNRVAAEWKAVLKALLHD